MIFLRKFILLGIFLFLPLASVHAAPSVSLVPARTAGVAPLSVFFDASGTTDASVTSKPFHDLDYSWNFGDTGSGSWGDQSTGSSGSTANTSRNAAKGPLAVHVFETPGTYTVTLTVSDGSTTSTQTQTITVTDPNTVFAGAMTVCVSTSGNFTGCPPGATQAANTSNFATAMGNITSSRKRLLFRCGETWTGSGVDISQAGPGLVGAYNNSGMVSGSNSSCTKPKGISINVGASDWRVLDLELSGAGNGVSASNTTAQQLFQRLYIHDTSSIGANLGSWGNQLDQATLADSTITRWSGGQGVWSEEANRVAVVGNIIQDAIGSGEHDIRVMGPDRAIVSHNYTQGAGGPSASSKENITIRGEDEGPLRTANKIIIADNKAVATGASYAVMAHTANITDMITERNWVIIGVAGAGISFEPGWLGGNQIRMTVRNNLIEGTGSASDMTGVQFTMSGDSGGAIYNNTFYSGRSSGSFGAVYIASGVSGTVVKNNLAYAPNMGANATFLDNSGSGTVTSNNSTDAQMRGTNPSFTTTPPTTPTGFQIKAGSYAIGAGTSVPVWSDFFGNVRGGTFDLGAHQYSGGSPPPPDTQAPSIPAGLSSSAMTTTSFTLSWAASNDNVGVTGYKVFRDGTQVATPTTNSVSVTGLTAGTAYAMTVSANDAAGNNSVQSSPLTVMTYTPPSIPSNLTATAVSSSQINLSWGASTSNLGITGYRVYRGGTLLTTLGNVTTYQNTGLAAATLYSYTVSAVDAAGNASVQSASASATTPSVVPQPIQGDINLDHIVKSLDWSLMNAKWFTTDATTDLNHDGIVNAIDFSLLNANWFKTW